MNLIHIGAEADDGENKVPLVGKIGGPTAKNAQGELYDENQK